jgi:uncharacterized membrane protein YfcA
VRVSLIPKSVHTTPLQLFLAALAAAAGSAVNAIAGGGTLITFPTLIAIGIPPIVANATSSVALWPGTVGSMWGYRRELAGARSWAVRFAIPSLLGGIVGAVLLLATPPDRFATLVPFLVFGATLLFVAQAPIARLVQARRRRAVESAGGTFAPPAVAGAVLAPPATALLIYQLAVSVYGGYFGAGMGILMLAALGFMGLTNIHQMNGLKNWGGTCINVVAVTIFAVNGIVNWPIALVMAVGAAIGGYGASGLAQRVEQRTVRQLIIVIGFASSIWLLIDRS